MVFSILMMREKVINIKSGLIPFFFFFYLFLHSRLCKMKVTSIKTDVDISDVKLNSLQDFNENDLARKINTPDRNAVIVRSHFQFAGEFILFRFFFITFETSTRPSAYSSLNQKIENQPSSSPPT